MRDQAVGRKEVNLNSWILEGTYIPYMEITGVGRSKRKSHQRMRGKQSELVRALPRYCTKEGDRSSSVVIGKGMWVYSRGDRGVEGKGEVRSSQGKKSRRTGKKG